MIVNTIKTEPADDSVDCGNCQHSVDVRGVVEIVCLAHLAVFEPKRIVECDEFEIKRKTRPAAGTN